MRISDWSSDVCSSDLQVGFAGGRLGRDESRRGAVEDQFVDVGKLAASGVDAVEIGIAPRDEALSRRRGGICTGLQRRKVRIVEEERPVHATVELGPGVEADGRGRARWDERSVGDKRVRQGGVGGWGYN